MYIDENEEIMSAMENLRTLCDKNKIHVCITGVSEGDVDAEGDATTNYSVYGNRAISSTTYPAAFTDIADDLMQIMPQAEFIAQMDHVILQLSNLYRIRLEQVRQHSN